MPAIRKAPLAVICLLLVALTGCNRQVSTNDFLPSSPAFQDALRLVLAALSVPADGSSTVRVEAQISPDADPDRRTVRFHTTLGTWVESGSDADKGSQTDVSADEAGKAAAFLKSAETAGVALVTVSVITTDSAGNVSTLASVTGEVTFTQVQDALELTVTPSSAFADGVSPVNLEARISADSPPSWTDVIFATDAGVFEDGTRTKEVKADSQRIARAQLTSVDIESGTVTATIKQFDSITVSQPVAFDQRNPNAISIGTSSDSVPADGESQINVFADIAAGLASREVAFTTTAGEFVNPSGSDPQRTTASANASNRATVRLKADKTITSVLLTATIALNTTTNQSSDKQVDFVRALPDFIELSADPSPASKAGDMESTITAKLSRDVGTVSENTVIEYTVEKTDGSAITDMEFRDVTRSDADQESTAVLYFGDTAEALPLVVVVKASPAGSSVTGEVSMTINP